MKRLAIGILLVALAGGAALAQNWQGQPTYGSVELKSGFRPDPFLRDVVAGGSESIEHLGFYGYVAENPDFDLYYTSGPFELIFRVEDAQTDTVLLVNAPDGSWHFNDDSDGLDPAIEFESPMDGLYTIWVGSYDGNFADATLVISELD
jgi:hypothetical protein